jgi:hypothetical protein
MLASIVITSSKGCLAKSIVFIGRPSPPIGTLFGPENIIWDLKPPEEIQVRQLPLTPV